MTKTPIRSSGLSFSGFVNFIRGVWNGGYLYSCVFLFDVPLHIVICDLGFLPNNINVLFLKFLVIRFSLMRYLKQPFDGVHHS